MPHIIRLTSGGVGVTRCADESKCGLSKALNTLNATYIGDIDESLIPKNDPYRNAWDWDNLSSRITIDPIRKALIDADRIN